MCEIRMYVCIYIYIVWTGESGIREEEEEEEEGEEVFD